MDNKVLLSHSPSEKEKLRTGNRSQMVVRLKDARFQVIGGQGAFGEEGTRRGSICFSWSRLVNSAVLVNLKDSEAEVGFGCWLRAAPG